MGLRTVILDNNTDNANWTKQSWDLPPYKSHEFFQLVPYEQLADFRGTEVYKHAVAQGRIYDDEWVEEHVKLAEDEEHVKLDRKSVV